MPHRRVVLVLVSIAGVVALAAPAFAANFSPTIQFTLSNSKVKANPSLTVVVNQDAGEEELASVSLSVPKGFKLAGDAAISGGERLGSGQIKIALEPLCTSTETVNVNITERDRTSAEKAAGVKAVWVVDLHPITTIDLLIKGSATNGWKLSGQIPPNDATCPPFTFSATINPKSSTSGTKIVTNPSTAGTYTFKASFKGVNGSTSSSSQQVSITP